MSGDARPLPDPQPRLVETLEDGGGSGATRGGNQSFHTSKAFDPSSCGLLYVLTDDRDRYLVPASRIRATTTLNLGRRYDEHRLRG
jgi:hypothetical protein